MSGQIITIRGTHNDCWIVDRFVSDDAQAFRQSGEEEWFEVLAAHWVVAYDEFFEAEALPCPAVHFVFRRAPIVC